MIDSEITITRDSAITTRDCAIMILMSLLLEQSDSRHIGCAKSAVSVQMRAIVIIIAIITLI